MWKRLAVAVAVLAALGYFSGCVGLAAVVRGTGTYEIDEPKLSTIRGSRPATDENIRQVMGEPDAVTPLADGSEEWRYRNGLRWHGVALLLVVLPVPLLIPTGFNEVVVTFDGGRAVHLDGQANTSLWQVGCLWAPALSFGNRRGCFAEGYAAPPPSFEREQGSLWAGPE